MKRIRLPRIPRLRLKRSPAPARRTSPGRVRFLLTALALLLVSFVVGLYVFFPTRALSERISHDFARQTGAELRMGDLALLFPPGLKAERVVVTGLPGRERLEAPFVTLKPLWQTLAGKNPGVSFLAGFQGGRIEGKTRKSGALEAKATGIRFNEPLLSGSDLRLSGLLSQGEFDGAVLLQPETQSRLTLSFQDVRMTGMEGLGVSSGALSLGTVTLRAEGKGSALRIDTVAAAGGDLEVSGSGTLLLTKPTERSRINLNLVLRPASGLDPNLRDLLGVFAQEAGDGSFRLRLAGTLASPAFAQ